MLNLNHKYKKLILLFYYYLHQICLEFSNNSGYPKKEVNALANRLLDIIVYVLKWSSYSKHGQSHSLNT